MKLTQEQTENLKSSVQTMVTGLLEGVMNDTSDNYFRDRVMDMLDMDEFSDDEIDEIREMWDDVDKEGGIDDSLYVKFVGEIVNSVMEKYK
jgi:predicted transcriptional regulator